MVKKEFQNIYLVMALLGLSGALMFAINNWQNPLYLAIVMFVGAAICLWRWRHVRLTLRPAVVFDMAKLKPEKLQKIKIWLMKNIVGQGKSVHALLDILKRNTQLVQHGRHMGSFLFFGPTGTGKTFCAQLLAEGLYGKQAFLNIPMNQAGAAGALTSDKISQLILDALKLDPHRVILLDEIDKADATVRASLYQFIDTGMLMDPGNGEWLSCPGAIIIATTNAGSQGETNHLNDWTQAQLLDHLAQFSHLEKAFLSRFEGLYWFGPLAPMDIAQVSILQLMRYYQQHGLNVRFLCAEAIAEIVKENQQFSEFGVRQLIQVIRRKSDSLIAQAKGQGLIDIVIDMQQGQFVLGNNDRVRKAG